MAKLTMKNVKKNKTTIGVILCTVFLVIIILGWGIIPAFLTDTDGDGLPDYVDPDPYTPEDWGDDPPIDDDPPANTTEGVYLIQAYVWEYEVANPNTRGNPCEADWDGEEMGMTIDFNDGFTGVMPDDTWPPYEYELTVYRWTDGHHSEYPEGPTDGLLYYNFATDEWQTHVYIISGTWSAGDAHLVIEEQVNISEVMDSHWVMADFWVWNADCDAWHTIAAQV